MLDPSTIKALSQLHYDREMEAEADAGAVSMLNQVRIDPIGLHQFLSTMDHSQDHGWGDWLEFLSTHPDTKKRIQAIEKLRLPSVEWNHSLLTQAEWSSLQTACGS